jgi:hypothetical protein
MIVQHSPTLRFRIWSRFDLVNAASLEVEATGARTPARLSFLRAAGTLQFGPSAHRIRDD